MNSWMIETMTDLKVVDMTLYQQTAMATQLMILIMLAVILIFKR